MVGVFLSVVVALVGSLISNAHELKGENITSSHQKRNLLHNFNHKNIHCNPMIGRWKGNQAEKGEVSCLVAVSRFRESGHLKDISAELQHNNIPLIILNTGDDSLHDYCDYPILANVGRESFHYLHYIVEYYHHPDFFAPYNIFCQADIDRSLILPYLNNHLCNPQQAYKTKLNGGFSFFGTKIYPFHTGLFVSNRTFYSEGIHQIYGELGINTTQEWMKFVPNGCFVVSKTQLYTRPYEYYFQALKWVGKGFQPELSEAPLNEGNSPAVGHLLERAWPQVFNSSCQHEKPWCCSIDCALTHEI